MKISSAFDSGNIEVIDATDPMNICLDIRKDNRSDFYQWFHFRVDGVRNQELRLRIQNAGGAAYVDGWTGYKAVASYEGENWFRVDTAYNGGVLTISHCPAEAVVYYAYFAPYSMARHDALIDKANRSPLAEVTSLGQTLDGQSLDLIRMGSSHENALKCWIIARQHPGETMAEWWMEGCLERLLDCDDPVSRALLAHCTFSIVPNMNPDGSKRGHLRTNAAGANLNREWLEPSMEHSPEVYLVRQAMAESGVDFHMDVHGDEAIPHNFVAGYEGIPGLLNGQQDLLINFARRLTHISPDFQTKVGYPPDAPGSADLLKCTDYVAETFGCLAMTLEMPFKDNDDLPDPVFGWSPGRSKHLARSCLDALYQSLDEIATWTANNG